MSGNTDIYMQIAITKISGLSDQILQILFNVSMYWKFRHRTIHFSPCTWNQQQNLPVRSNVDVYSISEDLNVCVAGYCY